MAKFLKLTETKGFKETHEIFINIDMVILIEEYKETYRPYYHPRWTTLTVLFPTSDNLGNLKPKYIHVVETREEIMKLMEE